MKFSIRSLLLGLCLIGIYQSNANPPEEYLRGLRGRFPGVALTAQKYEEVGVYPYFAIIFDANHDSQQIQGTIENIGTLFPSKKDFDRCGRDRKDQGQFSASPAASSVGAVIKGPDIGSVKTIGAIETNFIGFTLETLSSLHLKHIFSMLYQDDWTLLMGEYWNPLAVPECWPLTVVINGGAPFEPVSRNPQVRFSKNFDKVEGIFAFYSQMDFDSNGPLGNSTVYIEDAVVPNLHAQIKTYGENYVCGAAVDYKRLKPRLVSDKGYSVDEHVDSFIAEAYFRYDYGKYSVRMKGLWGQNGSNLGLLSGYGVRTINPITDERTYANTATATFWIDAYRSIDERNSQIGIFAGFLKNLGSRQNLFIDPRTNEPIIYALANSQDIDTLFRVSPRFIYQNHPLVIALECEYSQAAWGKPNNYAHVVKTVPNHNVRFTALIAYVY